MWIAEVHWPTSSKFLHAEIPLCSSIKRTLIIFQLVRSCAISYEVANTLISSVTGCAGGRRLRVSNNENHVVLPGIATATRICVTCWNEDELGSEIILADQLR